MEVNVVASPAVTNFVNDFLVYQLNLSGYQWTSQEPAIAPEDEDRTIASKVGLALRSLADEFTSQYKENFTEMCERLEITEENLAATIVGVANELFSEGIKWARIVAFFVFGSELALNCKERNSPQLIDTIAVTLSVYITDKLLPWINDHGGWEGLVIFNEGSDPEQERSESRWPTLKNIMCLGLSALGALSLGAFLTKTPS